MRLVWLSWKDKTHPLAGGAEKVTHNLLKRLARDGHQVTLLTSRPRGTTAEEVIDGYKVIRQGSRYSVYWKTARYYRKHLRASTDLVVEEINTIPFFSRFYTKTKTVLFFHQLAREVWFYQMVWPLSLIGYLCEPIYLRLLRGLPIVTISKSTEKDLRRHGFASADVQIMREGIDIPRLKKLPAMRNWDKPILLSFGAVRPMKRTLDIVKAFEFAKPEIPALKLVIAGSMSDPYANKVQRYIQASPYRADIAVMGAVSDTKKRQLMHDAHVQAAASIKEGWGLIITEANSQGTPVVAYDSDGQRDSIKHGKTGVITNVNSRALGKGIVSLLTNQKRYEAIRKAAWQDSAQYTFDVAYDDFMRIIRQHASE